MKTEIENELGKLRWKLEEAWREEHKWLQRTSDLELEIERLEMQLARYKEAGQLTSR